jgi:hypothetical protein
MAGSSVPHPIAAVVVATLMLIQLVRERSDFGPILMVLTTSGSRSAGLGLASL